jgi:hypothetical protein
VSPKDEHYESVRGGNGTVTVSVREYFEKIIAALKELVIARLDAMQKATDSAFAASEKAIIKAEQAQSEYNVRSNEFRGQLDDQAKTLMPRTECMALFKGQEDKANNDRASTDRRFDEFAKDIRMLRESKSEGGGEKEALRDARAQSNWRMGIVVAVILAAMSALFSLLNYMNNIQHLPVR